MQLNAQHSWQGLKPNAGKLAKLASTGDANTITATKCGLNDAEFELAQTNLYDAISI